MNAHLLCFLFSPEVISIAENPKSTAVCVEEFHSKLRWLMDNCGYTLDAEDEQPSLLIRLEYHMVLIDNNLTLNME